MHSESHISLMGEYYQQGKSVLQNLTGKEQAAI